MRKNGSRQEMRCSQTPNRRRRFSAFNVIDRELQIAALKVWNSITAADSDLKSRLSYACDLVPVLFPVRPNVPRASCLPIGCPLPSHPSASREPDDLQGPPSPQPPQLRSCSAGGGGAPPVWRTGGGEQEKRPSGSGRGTEGGLSSPD